MKRVIKTARYTYALINLGHSDIGTLTFRESWSLHLASLPNNTYCSPRHRHSFLPAEHSTGCGKRCTTCWRAPSLSRWRSCCSNCCLWKMPVICISWIKGCGCLLVDLQDTIPQILVPSSLFAPRSLMVQHHATPKSNSGALFITH